MSSHGKASKIDHCQSQSCGVMRAGSGLCWLSWRCEGGQRKSRRQWTLPSRMLAPLQMDQALGISNQRLPEYQSSQVRLVRMSDTIHCVALSPVITAQQQPASTVPPTLVPTSSALRNASRNALNHETAARASRTIILFTVLLYTEVIVDSPHGGDFIF